MARADLRGFTAAVTADRRRDEQTVLLHKTGMDVVVHPLLRTDPEDEAAVRALTGQLVAEPPDMLLANTGYGMRTWFAQAGEHGQLEGLVGALAGAKTGARGAKALGELRKAGLDATYKAPSETLDELVAWALDEGVAGQHVVLQLHGEPSDEVVRRLSGAGATVTCVYLYKMGEAGERTAGPLIAAVLEGTVDVVTFTAAPQLEALGEVAQARSALGDLVSCFNRGGVIAACIGPVCSAGATSIGIAGPLVPEHARLGSLATAVGAALSARQLVLAGDAGPVELSGAYCRAGDEEHRLTPAQRGALRPLTVHPGEWAELGPVLGGADLTGLADRLDGALEVDGPRARLRT